MPQKGSPRSAVPSLAPQRLLAAAAELLTTDPEQLLRRAFTAETVSRTAGVARRTFYEHFPTTSAFVETLLNDLTIGMELADDQVDRIEAASGDLRAVVDQVLEQQAGELAVGRRGRAARTIRWMGAGDGPNDRSPEPAWAALVEMLDRLGWHPRPPFTAADVALALEALAVGMVAEQSHRHREAASTAALGALAAMTASPMEAPGGDPAEALLRQVRAAWLDRASVDELPNVRRMVLDAAAQEIANRGASQLDHQVLSERTGLSAAAIVRYVGSRGDILRALLDQVYPGLDVALRRELDQGELPMTALRAHLVRLVRLCRHRREVAEADLALRRIWATTPSTSRYHELDRLVGETLRNLVKLTRHRAVELGGLTHQLTCTLALDESAVEPARCADLVLALVEGAAGPKQPGSADGERSG